VTGRVRTGRCNLELFRGGSKFKVNIGKLAFCEDRQTGKRSQDVVPSDGTREAFLIMLGL
jgi:hypothetical protein